MMTVRDRACLNKRRFDTRELCEAAISRARCVLPLFAYKCRYGDHWHMTKIRPENWDYEKTQGLQATYSG